MYNNPYSILGIKNTASKEEIKKAYKEIALSCHPDKLVHLNDLKEKEGKIEKFKAATIAYNNLMNDEISDDTMIDESDWEKMDWSDIWKSFFRQDTKDIIADIANIFMHTTNLHKPKLDTDKIKHEIKLQVSYQDILTNAKRKLRLILVDIDEPLFVDIHCGAYPKIVKEYTDDDDKIHDIIINMEIRPTDNFEHIISENGAIDIITNVDISLLEYIYGYQRDLQYVDGSILQIVVPAWQRGHFEVKGKGIKGGSLLVNISINYITKADWEKLDEKDKDNMIRILNILVK